MQEQSSREAFAIIHFISCFFFAHAPPDFEFLKAGTRLYMFVLYTEHIARNRGGALKMLGE